MRLAHIDVGGSPRLCVETPRGWADAAQLTLSGRTTRLSGLLAAGPAEMSALAGALDEPYADTLVASIDDAPLFTPLLDRPGKIICAGRNYTEHAREMGRALTGWPEIFLRLPGTVIGPYDDVKIPGTSTRIDYEGELGVVIATGGRYIPASDAESVIAGYTVLNDITMRDWQHRGLQWTPGKNFDGTLPVGPALVTAAEVDASNLLLETRVNGELVQRARTSQMIFGVAALIEFISSWTTLAPGDLIATGTPGGVGAGRNPPLFLSDGDVIEVTIEGVGGIRNRIVNDGLDVPTDRWSTLAAQQPTAARVA